MQFCLLHYDKSILTTDKTKMLPNDCPNQGFHKKDIWIIVYF